MKKYVLFSSVCVWSTVVCYSNGFTKPQKWINYTDGQGVSALADYGNELWIGTSFGGLICLNKTTNSRTFYNRTNSGLPNNCIGALAIDGRGNKWIGTYSGLAKFDGTSWIVYNKSNSGLPDNLIQALAIDGNNHIWVGTGAKGLTKFDGTSWTIYNESNSGLPFDIVNVLAIDRSNNIWIGTQGGGLAKFDGTSWTVFNTSNSGLPSNGISSLVISNNNNIWVGTGAGDIYDRGLAKFDGTSWTVYNISNSSLPSNYIPTLAIDGSNNIWIGTYGRGLAKFDGASWSVHNESNSGLPNNYVHALAIDRSNNMWIGTGAGLVKFESEVEPSIKIKSEALPKIETDEAVSKFLITPNSVGLIKIGDTKEEVHMKMLSYSPWILQWTVDRLLVFDPSTATRREVLVIDLDNYDRVNLIYVITPQFITAERIHVGSTLGDAERAYGKARIVSGEGEVFAVFNNMTGIYFYLPFDYLPCDEDRLPRSTEIAMIEVTR